MTKKHSVWNAGRRLGRIEESKNAFEAIAFTESAATTPATWRTAKGKSLGTFPSQDAASLALNAGARNRLAGADQARPASRPTGAEAIAAQIVDAYKANDVAVAPNAAKPESGLSLDRILAIFKSAMAAGSTSPSAHGAAAAESTHPDAAALAAQIITVFRTTRASTHISNHRRAVGR